MAHVLLNEVECFAICGNLTAVDTNDIDFLLPPYDNDTRSIVSKIGLLRQVARPKLLVIAGGWMTTNGIE